MMSAEQEGFTNLCLECSVHSGDLITYAAHSHRAAHVIILEVLHIQQKRFKLEGFDPLYDECVEDWKEIRGVDDMGNRKEPGQDCPTQN